MKNHVEKRMAALLLALALCVSAAPRARAAESLESYADLDGSAWYAPGVRFCLKNGLMSGYGTRIRLFEPDSPVTRAQFVTILWRMAGEPKTGLAMHYNDVPEGQWYTEAVRWAFAEDLMGGYTTVTFAPEDPITREQTAVFLWGYAKWVNGTVPKPVDMGAGYYGDRGEVSDHAREAVDWACALGIIAGYRDSRGGVWIRPSGNSSRAVVATMLMRFCLDLGLCE